MRITTRSAFVLLFLVSSGLLAAGLILGEVKHLQPCHLCIFQRFLYILMACFALFGALLPRWHRLWSALFFLTAGGGVLTALKQSWMQYAPDQSIECGFGDPTLLERVVNWLGGQWPEMFMVTGFCSDKDWVFLGLSLANWSGVCFLLLTLAAAWLLFRRKAA